MTCTTMRSYIIILLYQLHWYYQQFLFSQRPFCVSFVLFSYSTMGIHLKFNDYYSAQMKFHIERSSVSKWYRDFDSSLLMFSASHSKIYSILCMSCSISITSITMYINPYPNCLTQPTSNCFPSNILFCQTPYIWVLQLHIPRQIPSYLTSHIFFALKIICFLWYLILLPYECFSFHRVRIDSNEIWLGWKQKVISCSLQLI